MITTVQCALKASFQAVIKKPPPIPTAPLIGETERDASPIRNSIILYSCIVYTYIYYRYRYW